MSRLLLKGESTCSKFPFLKHPSLFKVILRYRDSSILKVVPVSLWLHNIWVFFPEVWDAELILTRFPLQGKCWNGSIQNGFVTFPLELWRRWFPLAASTTIPFPDSPPSDWGVALLLLPTSMKQNCDKYGSRSWQWFPLGKWREWCLMILDDR